ncbi:Tetratricopeptide repeat protein [Arachis hypogaea]|nr:Tetratricopeptide repeat protein [Arachis hypogaea]
MRNLEIQMGQLAQRMEKSTNFFSSDTIPNPQEECKAIYLRNGKVVREEKEETKESSDKQGKEATEDIIQQEEHVTPTILFVDRKYEEALFQYELALQVALNMSSSVEVRLICHANRAACYQKLGKYDSTVKECTQALELNPAYIIKALARRGEAHDKLEHFEEAIADMKRILEIDPSNDQARKGICRLEPLAAEKREKMKEEMMDKWKLCILMHIRVFINMVTEIARMEFLEFIKGSRDVNGAGRGMPPCSPSSPPELIPIPARSPSWGDNCPHPHSPRSPYSPQGPIPHPLMFNIHRTAYSAVGVLEFEQSGDGRELGLGIESRWRSKQHIGGGKTVKAKIKSVKSKDEGESLKFTHKNLIDKICTDSADAKIPAVLEYLGTFIEGKKVGCIRIDGGRPAASRQQLVTDFREEDSIKVAVAEDRAHRIGKVSPVNIYYLLANDTVDDIIWDVVQFKLDNLGLVHLYIVLELSYMLDGHENTLAVSNNQPLSSPAKHTTIEHSPLRQRTLDQFVRRCDNADRSEHQPDPKRPC